MNVEEVREYCLSKAATTESFPFDDTSLVLKVVDKMFAIISLDESFGINLKCDPERAIDLRETHPEAIKPGYHMNKKHWNTVIFNGSLPDDLVRELIDHSYGLVVESLPKKKRDLM